MGLRPGPFLKRVLFALRALFSLGLRPALFRPSGVALSGPAARILSPSGHFASGGELFARPKSSSKMAPSGGPAGPSPHLQPSWGFPPPRPSARVAGHCAKYGTYQHCSLYSTSCLRHEAFKRPCANFALLHVNPQVDKMQSKPGIPTALYSRLLKAGGWPQKLLLTPSIFCAVFRDPR